MPRYYSAKTDHNQTEIAEAFRRHGWYVLPIHRIKNACDLMISRRFNHGSVTVAVEVKNGRQKPSNRKLSDGEKTFREEWQGHWRLAESVDDVLAIHNEFMNPPQ